MSPARGTRLGPYEITAKLGEVSRATDNGIVHRDLKPQNVKAPTS